MQFVDLLKFGLPSNSILNNTKLKEIIMNSINLDTILSNPYVQQFLLWAGLGLAVGVAAKIIIPGTENMGWIRTIGVGLIGTFVGNYLAPKLFQWPAYEPMSLQGIGVGILGAVILVVVNRIVTKS
jgi:uncharacterized membrane protein YeaQ/YmgE (transglycosylase-associated protein family)